MFNIYYKTKEGKSKYFESWFDEESAHKRMLELTKFDKDAESSKRKNWYEVIEE